MATSSPAELLDTPTVFSLGFEFDAMTIVAVCLLLIILLGTVISVALHIKARRKLKKQTDIEKGPRTMWADCDFTVESADSVESAAKKTLKSVSPIRKKMPRHISGTYLHRRALGEERGPLELRDSEDEWMARARDAQGRTPLHCLAASPIEKKSELRIGEDLDDLLRLNVDVNARDNDGNTAIHLCVVHERSLLLAAILRLPDADPCVENNSEMTALHLAAECRNIAALNLLLGLASVTDKLRSSDDFRTSVILALIHTDECEDIVRRVVATDREAIIEPSEDRSQYDTPPRGTFSTFQCSPLRTPPNLPLPPLPVEIQ